ncbi:MAG TPA: sugar phosphate isomerase/epimerase [Polyangiaceae bacterium]|jgi:sugar phosphate isomerase/epimerase|nr:sugar phosphate isomerase/epimerase [Polyangiaceae bacterium]
MKIAVQHWSVRDPAKENMQGTLAELGKLGFDGIEFFGPEPAPARDLKKWCEDAGLEVAGYHVPFDDLFGRPLERNVEYHRELGNKRLICPFVPEQHRKTAAAWGELVPRFNQLSQELAAHGMLTGFHNHRVEFEPIEGQLPWQIFFDKAAPEVVMQLDVGNAAPTGQDPIATLERYPGRARSVHIKDWSPSGPVLTGDGTVPLVAVFELCKRQGKTDWYIIEQDIQGMPQVECVGRCLEKFRHIAGLA